ncbi:Helix-turn-helix domain-containing protein [Sinosporangium album]|uniref:Helix-turn-helix domain-containing protein n=1 Tax=Sinosporangium album TaxID=504805 RepID=A0A1G7R2X4_9ACTN|nr:helix-turn-helix transcriptional regulator [Sinosporangium album]SDG05141.1 Helix-turn-helix domain-containing protein [Sinosporangium album]
MSSFQQARLDLATRLRRLREHARLTGKELAERMAWQPSKVSRIENARQNATEADVAAWAHAVQADEAVAGELIALAAGLHEQSDSWRHRQRAGLAVLQENIRDVEGRTRLFRVFEPGLVIGLLQTAEYARHIFSKVKRVRSEPDEVDAAIRVRMQRQEILYDRSRTFRFLMPEAVLYYRLAPTDVMLGQLDRLLAVGTLANVEFGIIPFQTELPAAPVDGFWIYDDDLVSVPTRTKDLMLRDAEDVGFYSQAFEELRRAAVFGEDARAIVVRVLACLTEQG